MKWLIYISTVLATSLPIPEQVHISLADDKYSMTIQVLLLVLLEESIISGLRCPMPRFHM